MLRYLITLSALACIIPQSVQAEDIAVQNSSIESATVYTDRASVTREATVSLPAGSHNLVFSGLTPYLMPDSLRVEGSALAKVKFGAVVYKQVMASEITGPKANELNQELETLADQRKVLEGEQQSLESKKTFLTTIGTQAALRTNENIAEMNLKPEQWTQAAQTLYSSLNETISAQIAVEAKMRDLDKKIAKVQSDLNALGSGNYTTYSVTIPLESPAATDLKVKLSYQVSNAGWQPVYDARLDTNTSQLELIQYGAVYQSTGEDWAGVALTLSTAQPHRGTSLPDLSPFWVDIWQEQAYDKSAKFMSMGASNVAAAPEMARAMEADAVMQDQRSTPLQKMEEASFETAEISTGGFVSEYKIPGPATIKADGTATKVMVGNFSTESTLQVHIKPQLSTDAFLVSKAKLKGDSPILPGQVSLFRNGAYVGQSTFPLLRPDEEHALFFGTDDQISVKRKVLKDEKTDAGIIMRDNVQERHYVTEVQNLRKTPVTIVVKETIPAGRNDEIVTQIIGDATTQGFEKDSANIKGLLRWEFSLEPKAKKDLKLGWKVTWPKDKNISGL
jgi:uncharacterized protein (TIGR02231 family)